VIVSPVLAYDFGRPATPDTIALWDRCPAEWQAIAAGQRYGGTSRADFRRDPAKLFWTGEDEVARALLFAWIVVTSLFGVQAMSVDGLITLRSSFGPQETMRRLEAEVSAKGMTVFAHVDHAAGATAAGLPLRPTDLLIFGAAKGGTPLMQSVQTIGIDLPLKALVWQDEDGTTFVTYNDPAHLAQRHGLGDSTKSAVEAMSGALKAIAARATTAS
jgi:uncharacterized protein (DUF302 family)